VTEPRRLRNQGALACHDEMLRAHGGADGSRDEGLLDSALARPQHLFAYERADLGRLAAAYAHGISRNHPFVDGNKRAAFLCAATFLAINGIELRASPAHAVVFMLALAAGELSEEAFAAWLRDHTAVTRKRAIAKRTGPRKKSKQSLGSRTRTARQCPRTFLAFLGSSTVKPSSTIGPSRARM